MDQNAGMKIKKTDQKIGKIPRETDRCPFSFSWEHLGYVLFMCHARISSAL